MAEAQGDGLTPQPDRNPHSDTFDTIKRLAKANPDAITRPFSIGVSSDGRTDAKDVAKVVGEMPAMDLKDVQSGDVIWWKNEAGTSEYYLLVKDSSQGIKGALQGLDEKGEVKRQYEDINLTGAEIGTMVVAGKLLKGAGVTMVIPPKPEEVGKELPKELHTSPVADMGIIKNTTLNPQA